MKLDVTFIKKKKKKKKKKKITYLPTLFFSDLVSGNTQFFFLGLIGLEKLYKDDMYRKNRENLWKKKLNTFYPYGINTKEI